jgi:alpha-tubulin N-acetyltransferase 1
VGVKKLFLYDPTGMVHEKKSLCVLDFYVHESKQRTGLGKQMFDFMLEVRISYSSTVSN